LLSVFDQKPSENKKFTPSFGKSYGSSQKDRPVLTENDQVLTVKTTSDILANLKQGQPTPNFS
jgi:hypothetical protein